MYHFWSLFRLVVKRSISKRNIILFVLLLILSFYSTQQGVIEYKKKSHDLQEFTKAEKSFFKSIRNYSHYSLRGTNIYYFPSCSSIFFDHPILLSGLSGMINSIITLNIFNSCRGGIIIKGTSPFKFRFSNMLLVLGGLLVLFFGFEPMRNIEFLKFLSSHWSAFWVYLSINISRVLIFIVGLIVIFICCLGFVFIQSFNLDSNDFKGLIFAFISMILMLTFFFIIGTILGSFRSKFIGIAGLLSVWIFFVFLYPALVNSVIEEKSKRIPSFYKIDSEKIAIMNKFENQVIKKFGKPMSLSKDVQKEMIKGFLENDFIEIEVIEENLKQNISELISLYNNIYLLMPTTFYYLTCEEVSSRGYQSYLSFYSYLQKLREEFVRFWIDRVYYHDPKEMVNFVKKDENLFFSKSHLPPLYWLGVGISLFYNIVLLVISFLFFRRSMFHISNKDLAELGPVDLELDKGDLKVLFSKGNHLNLVLFNLFSGETLYMQNKELKGEILVDEIDISKEISQNDFVYLCHPSELPGDLSVNELLSFYAGWKNIPRKELKSLFDSDEIKPIRNKNIHQLMDHEKFEVLMGILSISSSDIYLINDITVGLPMTCAVKLKEKMEELKQDAIVIYLTRPENIGLPSLRNKTYFEEGDAWLYLVESQKQLFRFSQAKK